MRAVYFNGREYLVDASSLDDYQVLQDLQNSSVVSIVLLLMGDQFEVFRARERSPRGVLRTSTVSRLFEALMEQVPELGKLLFLSQLLSEHQDELEADFQQTYHLDLGLLNNGELGVMRAATLTRQLPPGSRIWSAAGIDAMTWSAELHRMTDLADLVQHGNYIVANLMAEKASEPPPLMQRPGDKCSVKAKYMSAGKARWEEAQRQRERQNSSTA